MSCCYPLADVRVTVPAVIKITQTLRDRCAESLAGGVYRPGISYRKEVNPKHGRACLRIEASPQRQSLLHDLEDWLLGPWWWSVASYGWHSETVAERVKALLRAAQALSTWEHGYYWLTDRESEARTRLEAKQADMEAALHRLLALADVMELPTTSGAGDEAAGLTWKEAAERMQRLRARGEPWTSYGNLAKQFGCSKETLHKAVNKTPELQGWAKRLAATPRVQSLNNVVTDRTAQSCEPGPEDNAALREFIEKANPQDKAWFFSLSQEAQLEVVNDPDRHQQILGRKP